MKVFIPFTDEMLEQGFIPDELVAYQPGMALLDQSPTKQQVSQSRSSTRLSPKPTPRAEAVPAFNSSTYLAGTTLG